VIYQVAAATAGGHRLRPAHHRQRGDKVMLNFVGADVHEVVSSVLAIR